MNRALVCVVLAVPAAMFSQIGQYPGGYPPGGGYPGGGGPGIPWPHKSKGQTGKNGSDANAPEQQLTRVSGKLNKIDEKLVVVDVPDGRAVQFQIDAQTKFYKDSAEIKASELKVGDQVSVEGPQDKEGILHAQSIRLEKSAPAEAAQSGTAEQEAAAPATTDAPPAVSDPNDPGPPMLKRGAQPRTPVSDDKPVSYDKRDDKEEAASEQTPAADPVIEKARAASEVFSQKLPNYVCTEFIARFQSESRPVDWRPLDVVSTEVVYEGTKESYRNIQINGKAVHKTIEEIGGAWSTGEFGTTLRDLFSPATGAEFHFRRQGTSGGMTGRVYDFTVERQRSHWHVQLPSQSINPAYRGAVWIEPSSGRVLRIEIQARALPKEFPVDTVESAIDYQKVHIGAGDYLLPVHAESLSCERGTSYCSRNTIDFRNYHKYEADSSITFAKE